MNIRIILVLISFILVTLFSFWVVKANQSFIMKNYIFAKQDLENNITRWADYVGAIDVFVDSRKDSAEELVKILMRIDNTLPLLSNSRTHQQFRYIVLYLEQKIYFSLVWNIKLEANHPLAWKTLTFKIELIDIEKWLWNSSNNVAENGDFVSVNYIWYLEDGSIFDSSFDSRQTLDYYIWAERLPIQFENAVIWMSVGEEKTIVIYPDQAYWLYDPYNFLIIPKSEFQYLIDGWITLEIWEKLPTQFWELEILEVYE